MIKIAINGFGRIGRPSFKIAFSKEDVEIVAINDLTDLKTAAHLLKYDSSYGKYEKEISIDEKNSELIVEGTRIKYFMEADPENLPWKELEVDVVLECTGVFDSQEKAQKHINAGAKKVILSAPPARNATSASNASRSDADWHSVAGGAKDEIPVYILGINENKYAGEEIISNGSCTTNCLASMIKVLDEKFGVEKGFMTTTHSYTNDQRLQDLPHRDPRRARAAALNIIPTTTGAAKTVGKVIEHLAGNLDGISLRVPTPTVSIVDFVCNLKEETTVEKINEAFKDFSENELKNILTVSEEELVSMDFKGNSASAIVDLPLTMCNGKLAKVVGWYDNEWGYSNRLVEIAQLIANK